MPMIVRVLESMSGPDMTYVEGNEYIMPNSKAEFWLAHGRVVIMEELGKDKPGDDKKHNFRAEYKRPSRPKK